MEVNYFFGNYMIFIGNRRKTNEIVRFGAGFLKSEGIKSEWDRMLLTSSIVRFYLIGFLYLRSVWLDRVGFANYSTFRC